MDTENASGGEDGEADPSRGCAPSPSAPDRAPHNHAEEKLKSSAVILAEETKTSGEERQKGQNDEHTTTTTTSKNVHCLSCFQEHRILDCVIRIYTNLSYSTPSE